MTSQLTQDLQAIRTLIADPSNWIQGDYAQTKEGVACGVLQTNAAKFCLYGAARNVTLKDATQGHLRYGRLAQYLVSYVTAGDNDTKDHAYVLAKLDEAIAASTKLDENLE